MPVIEPGTPEAQIAQLETELWAAQVMLRRALEAIAGHRPKNSKTAVELEIEEYLAECAPEQLPKRDIAAEILAPIVALAVDAIKKVASEEEDIFGL